MSKSLPKSAVRNLVIKITVNKKERDDIDARVKAAGPGFDRATFVRWMALCAHAPVAAEFAKPPIDAIDVLSYAATEILAEQSKRRR